MIPLPEEIKEMIEIEVDDLYGCRIGGEDMAKGYTSAATKYIGGKLEAERNLYRAESILREVANFHNAVGSENAFGIDDYFKNKGE